MKTVSAWPLAEEQGRRGLDWGYIKDQGNKLVIQEGGSGWIEVFPASDRNLKTVKYTFKKSLQFLGWIKKCIGQRSTVCNRIPKIK